MASVISRPTVTNDDGSGTTGTILNAAFFTDIFDRLDAMFSDTAIFAHGGGISTLALSTIKVDSAAGAELLHLKNWNTTNNNINMMVFMNKDAGGTERVMGYYGMRTTDHSTGAIVANFEWFNKSGVSMMTLSQVGILSLSTLGLGLPSAGTIAWSSRSIFSSPSDGRFTLTNAAVSAGVTFKFSTDSLLELRNRADGAFADFKAFNITGTGSIESTGGYSVNGTNGLASFSGAITNLTVQGGLVTAAS